MVNLCLKIYSKYISTRMQEWMLRLKIAAMTRESGMDMPLQGLQR